MPEIKSNSPSRSQHPGLLALWLVLAVGYLAASISGLSVVAMAVVGLMVGALLAASGRLVNGCLVGTALAVLSLYFSDSMQFVIYAPPLAAFAFMAYFFYRTLRAGSEPLITRVARREDPGLPPEVARYTRRLTWAWVLCFLLLFTLALLLAPVLAFDAWSRCVHGLGYIVPAALFLGEYAYRHHHFRDRPHSSLLVLIPLIFAVSKEAALFPAKRDSKAGP